jgi:amino acid transporter
MRTHHPFGTEAYGPRYYDSYWCLKPPMLLWPAVLYLSKGITLPFACWLGTLTGVNADAINLLRNFWTVETLLPSLIAAAVLYALLRRAPSAGRPVRWIWAHGRVLLALSGILDLVLLSISIVRQGGLHDGTLVPLVAAVIDLYCLVYILSARRLRDAWAEFPPRPESA